MIQSEDGAENANMLVLTRISPPAGA